MEMFEMPEEFLQGPKTYFADLDGSRGDETNNLWSIKTSRSLKTLLINGRLIFVGASHLNSVAVFNYLKKNPALLEGALIVPALRNDLTNITDCITIDGKVGRNMRSFYRDSIRQCVRWEHIDGSNAFKESILGALYSCTSILGSRLTAGEREKIATSVKRNKFLSRKNIRQQVSNLTAHKAQVFSKFCNLAYRLAGARILSSELSMEAAAYLDYPEKDLKPQTSAISHEFIFWKLLVEQVFDSLEAIPLTQECLDTLNWQEIEIIMLIGVEN